MQECCRVERREPDEQKITIVAEFEDFEWVEARNIIFVADNVESRD